MVARQRLPSATYHSAGDECWTRDVYADQMIAVHAQQHAAADIARHVAEKQVSMAPFFVMDVPSVTNAVDLWRTHMDRFTARYALRCNADPVLAQLLAESQDMGFEVANDRELETALSLVDPSKVVYSNPLWTRKTMKRAGEALVGTIVVSSEKELLDAVRLAPYSKILLAVQIPGCPVREEAYGCNIGCSVEDAMDLLQMGCTNFDGFSFNIDNTDTAVYFKAFKTIRELWSQAESYGLSPTTISVGGGFRSPKQEKAHFQEVCRDLHEAVEQFFPAAAFPFINLVATPGRFFATAAFSLCTNVIGKQKIAFNSNGAPLYLYRTNEEFYGAFGCRLADCQPEFKPLKEPKVSEEKQSLGLVYGPSVEALESHSKPFLSRQLSVGEWLLWENMGAYSMPEDDDSGHPIYYFAGKDNWEQINRRRFSHQQLETISDVGSDAASDVVTDDEDDYSLENLFLY